ncbi:MAG TPA: hypothetical protein VGM88_13785 [Kofleriaceae bacterium]
MGITALRFCGHLSLPPKPAPPARATGTQRDLLEAQRRAQPIFLDTVAKDAARAGVPTPTIAELSRVFPYLRDDTRHVLEVGQPAVTIAGLALRAVHTEGGIALEIANTSASDLAYRVDTQIAPMIAGCNSAPLLPFNAMVVAHGKTETRAECIWRDGMAIAVTSVETMAVGPLSAFYLSEVPPSVVGVDPRVGRGHEAPSADEKCSSVESQVVRSGLDRGQIGWRDLVDFYARHRCQTYQFPPTYRAFKVDGERALPDVGGSR